MNPACNHTDGGRHDCRYVDERNDLIPDAERLANGRADRNTVAWSREFFKAMDELWREKHNGIVRLTRRAAA